MVGNIIDQSALPEMYPTHMHESAFWENLGRVVGTFGFLEEVLGKAIFAFSGTTKYKPNEIEKAYAEWLPKLEKSLSNPLAGLIDTYGKAVRDFSGSKIENIEYLLNDLREASKYRNALCHGSWRKPDSNGFSVPLFVNKQNEKFETPVNIDFLIQVRKHTCELVCAVINTVTHIGLQFPGSGGPGEVIWALGIKEGHGYLSTSK